MLDSSHRGQRSIVINQAWNGLTPSHLSASAFDGYDAYTGSIPTVIGRDGYTLGPQSDLSNFDKIVKNLRRLPNEHIYPPFHEGLHQFEWPERALAHGNSSFYVKAPNIVHHAGNDAVARYLLHEATINEKLRKHPHPNLATYLGCIVHDGRIVRLVFRKYVGGLFSRAAEVDQSDDFSALIVSMDQIEAAAAHLHRLGLAHNDISPANIMFDSSNTPILIDFDSCAPLGSDITKGGVVAGWRGPLFDNGMTFEKSSVECDKLAIEYLRNWLMEEREKVTI